MTLELDQEIRAAIGDILDLADSAPLAVPASKFWRGQARRRSWAPRVALATAAAALLGVGLWVIEQQRQPTVGTGTATTSSAVPIRTTPPGSGSITPGVWTDGSTPPLELRWNNLSISTDHGWLLLGGITPPSKPGAARPGPSPRYDGAYYDDITGQWRTLPKPPSELFSQALSINGVWTGSEVVVVAGGAHPFVAAFDPSTFGWRTIDVPTAIEQVWPHGDGGAFQVAQVSYVAGQVVLLIAKDADWTSGASIFELDPSTGTWKVGAPLATNGEVFGGIANSPTQLFFLGSGRTSSNPCTGAVGLHTYDVANDAWSSQALSDGRWQPAIVVWTGTRLLLAGGQDCPDQPTRAAALLDPSTDSWTKAADLPADLDSAYPSPADVNGWVVALGESGPPFAYNASADRWWTGPTALIDGRAFAGSSTLVALGNGVAVWNPAVTDGAYRSLVVPNP